MQRVMFYLVLNLGCFTSTIWAYSGGTGEPNDPYQIATAQDLLQLGDSPSDYDKSFVLVVDVNLSDYIFQKAVIAAAKPDGRGGYIGIPFSGHFNGQDHVIKNLRIDSSGQPQSWVGDGTDGLGLFGCVVSGATISHLGLEDLTLQGGVFCRIGGLAGYNYGGHIVSCYTTGTITAGDLSQQDTTSLLSTESIFIKSLFVDPWVQWLVDL